MLYIIAVCLSSTVVLFGVAAVWLTTRRSRLRHAPRPAPPVSVLKPLCGADADLEANLATFFVQRYPHFEIVFGVEGAGDPAIAVVRHLQSRFPDVPVRLVVHGGRSGLNPKVRNLRAMLAAGSHDIVVVSDSNVAVDPDYLDDMVGQLAEPGVGMVTHLITGASEHSVGAWLDSLHLSGTLAGCVAASACLGATLTIGKSLMYRRSIFGVLGGLEPVADLLAEDHVMGRMVHAAGWQVRLSPKPVYSISQRPGIGAFLQRHIRWGLIRSRLAPAVYPAEIVLNPIAVAAVAPLFGVAGVWPLLWAVGLGMLRDGAQWLRLHGRHGVGLAMLTGSIKDILIVVVWLIAPLRSHVVWRGRRCRVGLGTRLVADEPGARRPLVVPPPATRRLTHRQRVRAVSPLRRGPRGSARRGRAVQGRARS